MTNRVDYSRMKKGESKKVLAAVASMAATNGRKGAKIAAKGSGQASPAAIAKAKGAKGK